MAITPNSYIKVLENVPLDSAHQNTLYWASTTAQQNYFSSKAKYTFAPSTYQRRNKSVLVPQSADNIYSCNYLMFQNTSYGARWFYAFIDEVNYINDNTCEIVFTIDPIQSWWGAWSRGMCYIEREHAHTDIIGDNLIPENIAIGDYEITAQTVNGGIDTLYIIVAATFNENYESASGALRGKLYSGLYYNAFSLYDVEGVNKFISGAVEKQLSDGIVSIFIGPQITEGDEISGGYKMASWTQSMTKVTGDFDGYTPKNNKLYTYPYNFIYVYTDDGTESHYAYEYFSGTNCTFQIIPSANAAPEVVAFPQNYKGVQNNLNEKITLSGYPQCPYNIDTYKAWLAQNASAIQIKAAQTTFNGYMDAVGGILNASLGKPQGAVQAVSSLGNTAFSLAQDLNTVAVQSRMPNSAKGQSTGGATFSNGYKNIYFCNMKIRGEFAKIIDDYWTKYGYPKHRLAIPDITARPVYTYTKTIGAYIYGDAPASDLQQIASYFDNGITFWQNPNVVGDYTVNNSV